MSDIPMLLILFTRIMIAMNESLSHLFVDITTKYKQILCEILMRTPLVNELLLFVGDILRLFKQLVSRKQDYFIFYCHT